LSMRKKIFFWHRPLMLAAGYPKALIPFHVPNNITCLCVSPLSFHIEILLYQHGRSALDTSRTLFLLASTQGVSCRLVSPDICICSLSSPPPHIYVSKCVYVYVHISLFLPNGACTTIIDVSLQMFSLMYCFCVSIIIVICICPPGTLIWLINLFLFLSTLESKTSKLFHNEKVKHGKARIRVCSPWVRSPLKVSLFALIIINM
jgi:hypothetical protein